ncbi:hypothetical protein OHA21_27045 [Actinoplanes sp. NBC_00393]|uniref:hypothetical protein n=1 Tax=Actinoplanes sp. NBC_00393 TaxID=2975953 RepID=UPI002E1CCE9A
MAPRRLERFLLEEAGYGERDQIWAGVIAGARQPATAEVYRILALGLAVRGLRSFRNRLFVRDRGELLDVDQDLAYGFLRRLTTIPLDATNLGGRLINSGVSYAKVHWKRYLDRPPAIEPDAAEGAAATDSSLQAAFDALVTGLAEIGTPLADDDIKLLALTSLDGRSVVHAASVLELPLQVAYKRRQRMEVRIRAYLRALREQEMATGPGATATAEVAAPSTRRTAARPGQPPPTQRSARPTRLPNSDRDRPATPHGSDPRPPAPAHRISPPR